MYRCFLEGLLAPARAVRYFFFLRAYAALKLPRQGNALHLEKNAFAFFRNFY